MMTDYGAPCLRAAVLGFLSCTMTGVLLAQPTLRITSPADGTVVSPGETLTVTVAASPERAFQAVIIVGEGDVGFSQARTAPPWEFKMQLPADITPRRYLLTADGATSPGHRVTSESITIDIERSDVPVSLRVTPRAFRLAPGAIGVLHIDGVFSDGTTLDLKESTLLRLASDAPGIATVNWYGIVTAVAPGSTKVIVSYQGIKVEVPVTVLGADRP